MLLYYSNCKARIAIERKKTVGDPNVSSDIRPIPYLNRNQQVLRIKGSKLKQVLIRNFGL